MDDANLYKVACEIVDKFDFVQICKEKAGYNSNGKPSEKHAQEALNLYLKTLRNVRKFLTSAEDKFVNPF